MIKFKPMKNTVSVYLNIFNSGLLLISDQFLLSCPIKINFKPSDRIKKLEKGRICGQMLDVSTDKGQLT